MTPLDWIEVYAEARVAFPPDVTLRTEDDLGRVKITAYCRVWEPPLPAGMADENLPSIIVGGNGDVLHRERVYALSFMVAHDSPPLAWVVGRAARQWAYAERTGWRLAFSEAWL